MEVAFEIKVIVVGEGSGTSLFPGHLSDLLGVSQKSPGSGCIIFAFPHLGISGFAPGDLHREDFY